jgi:hypothetical protein
MDMSLSGADGGWIPIIEYAMKRGVSVSTLRRRIRSNQVQHRLENGRYLILDEENNDQHEFQTRLESKLQKLESDLQRANEEISELKMLMALYEEKIPPRQSV